MAGDWIKVEKSSARKPEVLKIARMLGIPQDAAFGLLVRFWIWLDDNCVDGVVDGVVYADVDELMACPGLSALLKECGWATFSANPPLMSVVNFSRHNGETSKIRALKSERQAKWRNAPVDAPPSTRKEKKRDIKPIEQPARPKKLTEPTPEHQTLADSLGVACKTEFAKYRDWLASSGKQQKDEAAGFRNWLRKAAEFRPKLVEPVRQASHVPAKLPVNEVHTEMPDHVRAQLAQFMRTKVAG
jgi:hypothetical protein